MSDYSFDTNSTVDRTIISLADYGLKNALIIGKYHYKSARERLDSHRHKDTIEICYCHKGNQVYEVNDMTYTIKGGDVFVTFPDEIHSTGTQPEEKGVLYWLLVEVSPEKSFFRFDQKDGRTFTDALLGLPRRHFRGSGEMQKTLESIIDTGASRPGDMQKIILENLIVSFLLQVIGAAALKSEPADQVPENLVKIEKFIASHYKESLSIGVMAGMLNLSESRFKSWFKQQFGVPPLEFILRKRIEEAKKVLQSEKDLNMSDIAYDLGFSSPQHFATMFKRYTFLSPKEYKASSSTAIGAASANRAAI